MHGSVPLSAGQSSPSHPHLVPASQGLPWGPTGTGPSPRGDNSAFVSVVWVPGRGWALLPHKGIFWWGFGPFVPAVSLSLEASLVGVWRLPLLSLPEGAGMADVWGTGTLLASVRGLELKG